MYLNDVLEAINEDQEGQSIMMKVCTRREGWLLLTSERKLLHCQEFYESVDITLVAWEYLYFGIYTREIRQHRKTKLPSSSQHLTLPIQRTCP